MSGGYVCSFVVEACYDGKEPFFIGTFNIPRQDTFAATLAATDEATATAVGDFFGRHFPDGAPAPQAIKARLGSMMFVPDDYGSVKRKTAPPAASGRRGGIIPANFASLLASSPPERAQILAQLADHGARAVVAHVAGRHRQRSGMAPILGHAAFSRDRRQNAKPPALRLRVVVEPWIDPAGPPFRVECWRIAYIASTPYLAGDYLFARITRPSRHGRKTGFGQRSVWIDPWLQWVCILAVAAVWLTTRP